jgi:hypothetical protein
MYARAYTPTFISMRSDWNASRAAAFQSQSKEFSMNVTYNLSERDQHEEAVAIVEPLCLRGDSMNIYAGNDRAHKLRILVQCERSNVLLHEGALDLRRPLRRGPVRPWLFEVESIEPLLPGAKFHHVSSRLVQVWIGTDKEGEEFVVASELPEGPLFLFRAPHVYRGHCYVRPWPEWSARPIYDSRKASAGTAAAAIAGAQTAAGIRPGTGDPALDKLLLGLGDE